jgi:THO complex subunit 2
MQRSPDAEYNLTPTDFLKEAKEKIWTQLTPELYTLFWLFTLDDIYFPKERYDAEIEKLTKEVAKMEESKNNEGQVTSSKMTKSKIDKV